MPSAAPTTTPEYRQFTRQNYIASSEREGGIVHLWHMERLAQLRLTNEEHLVDTQREAEREAARAATAAQRRERDLAQHERRLYEENQILLRHLVSASDDAERRARNMQLCPAPDAADPEVALLQARADDQLRYRHRAKVHREREVVRQNKRLLKHLVDVKPGTKTAKELDDWYTKVHRKRLRQLSRFKKAEPFAGARILEKECGVRLGRNVKGVTARSHGAEETVGWGTGGHEESLERARYARPPLLAGQPMPPPSLGEVLASIRVPKALLPALQSTSYGGYALNASQAAEGDDATNSAALAAPLPSHPSRRPEWQSVAATDIPLMHYAADKMLAEPVPLVTAEEEGPCTQLWRRRVRRQREREIQTELRERVACSSMARHSLTMRELAMLSGSQLPTGVQPSSPSHGSTGLPPATARLPRVSKDGSVHSAPTRPQTQQGRHSSRPGNRPPLAALPAAARPSEMNQTPSRTGPVMATASESAVEPIPVSVERVRAAAPPLPPPVPPTYSSAARSPVDPEVLVAAAVAASVREQWVSAAASTAPFVAL